MDVGVWVISQNYHPDPRCMEDLSTSNVENQIISAFIVLTMDFQLELTALVAVGKDTFEMNILLG